MPVLAERARPQRTGGGIWPSGI